MSKRGSRAQQIADEVELRRHLNRSVETLCDDKGNVSKAIAERLVSEMAFWNRAEDETVAAAGHARRITGTSKTWAIQFGATTFQIAEALRRAQSTLKGWLFRETLLTSPSAIGILRANLTEDVRQCMTNRKGVRTGLYGGDDIRLVLGNQELRVDIFIDLLGKLLAFPALDSDLPRRMALPVPCPQCGQSVKQAHLQSHMVERCRKRAETAVPSPS